ncbi:hypothetical protein SARC_16609, partial [Sphaeroforma arctica JP610]
ETRHEIPDGSRLPLCEKAGSNKRTNALTLTNTHPRNTNRSHYSTQAETA